MSCFRLPDTFLRDLERVMTALFWNGGLEDKIHWKSRAALCRQKKVGGLGFCYLRECNAALLAKQAWRISMGEGGVLHSVLRHKYFPSSNLSEAHLRSAPSFTWRSILGLGIC
ncbi:UNVERIFIED_CONTAM: hypothetical protein Sradi_6935000 [Sesamum radiatum]|uniref:Uncharacterized protein n=1 Tax=Sesamum radiatum TaxID=300843 RepID=A0AAW2JFS6_SESRA